jgi:tRNA nucleotidyltransferase (CCA-adding enzyme)
MEIYAVGGCLRDELLGFPVKDHDWVVVGATPQRMLDAGFKPVGKDFPVFLHPVTHEEYALARTERKTAAGYHGFVFHTDPSVTLIQDLARRDFTVNAIARDKQGALIDPFAGQRDLQAGIFRHVSPAFVEDPVRILRMARFMARFENFTIAPETLALCVQMVAAGEVDALIPERVWQELSRGLMETMPSRMISTLEHCGALQRILPELATLEDIQLLTSSTTSADLLTHTKRVIDLAAQMNTPLPVRYAAMMQGIGQRPISSDNAPISSNPTRSKLDSLRAVCARLRVPTECRDLALLVALEGAHMQRACLLDAAATVHLLERCDALRKPERFSQALQVCEVQAYALEKLEGGQRPVYLQTTHLQTALAAARAVDAGAIAASYAGQSQAIKHAIQAARIQSVQAMRKLA